MTSSYPPSTPPTGTSSSDPDQIRRDIERTQSTLSTDVDALTDKVSPSRIAQRRVDRVRGTANRWKDKVMGSDPLSRGTNVSGAYGSGPSVSDRAQHLAGSASDTISGTAQSAASTVSDTASQAASTVQDAVQQAPQAVVRQTRGNPLAAGLIAFGAGWLVSSLLPASQREQELAEQAKQHASELGQPLLDAAKDAATEMKDNLQEPAQQAVESVRTTAADAGRTVTEEGRSAAQDVQDHAQDAAGTVRQSPPR
jgi:gas vesicle protein